MGAVVGVVFHIMGSSFSAADGWFHNPSAKASAHFGIKQDGGLVQWVDTADKAWHAVAANSHWIGVETEGASGPLSEAGCQTFARLYAWLHQLYGVPFQITDDPNNGRGFGWHGMGGSAWGGHDYCPGPERRAQRAHILQLAQGQPTPTPDAVPVHILEEAMFTVPPDAKAHDFPVPSWAKVVKPVSGGTTAKVAVTDGKTVQRLHDRDWWGPNESFTLQLPTGAQIVEVVNWGGKKDPAVNDDLNFIFDVA